MMRGRRLGEVVFALVVVALGVFVAVGTAQLPSVTTYARIGPKLFPSLVAGGLCAVGLVLLVLALRPRAEAERLELDQAPLLVITAGFAALMLLIEAAGFAIAATILFIGVAWAFGERRLHLTASIGLVLSIAVYLGFTRGLGLTLPGGPLEALW